ncbi:NUDC3 protein, partial [Ibidorhyncha struthersii]|nr:NUDC3 protein [Ibidorhyncha struthersii]
QAFKVFERMARQDDEKRRQELEAKLRKKEEEEAAASTERVKLPPAAQEVEVETTAEHLPAPDAGGAAGTQESAVAQDAAPSPVLAEPLGATAPAEPRPAELPTRQEQFQTNPDSYNGAVRENYAWSQDFSDLEIKVPVPKHIVKGKQVSVDISNSTIRVAVLEGSSQRVLMEGKLTHKINTESSLWSLEPGKCILVRTVRTGHVSSPWLAAPRGLTWKTGAAGSLSQVWTCLAFPIQRPAHSALALCAPVASLQKVHEMLKKGWDTEGSPFRGQKFDPSMFNISPGAVQF